ncbi:aminotransferase class III-fold pyridoxal phosphate-dependent enzyme [Candidatus Poribacteria bacterium]|nr:aminotransferase class III-fold pyridoxal phosphate-dependent enzyme [Candidatus Poribacteria bacterium]
MRSLNFMCLLHLNNGGDYMGSDYTTNRDFTRSLQLRGKAEKFIVGGGQPHKRSNPPDPVIIDYGKGCHIWDADGNEYIDYLMAYGPVLLGYAYPRVMEAVTEQIKRGNIFNVGHPLEIELAEKLVELIPSAERVTYFVGGSDATTGAVKLARAYTNRDKVVRSGYHGWHDWCHSEAGALKATAQNTLSMEYNDLVSLSDLFKENKDEIACVIMEPTGYQLPEEGYLEDVKSLCHENNTLLIFDEVKTGFRYSLGGAQEYFGITPDMSVFSKAMANGFGIAAVVGKKEIMDEVAGVWVAATFHGEVSMVAAALATIAEMEEKDGITYLWDQGEKLLNGYREITERLNIDFARIEGAGSMPFFGFNGGDDKKDRIIDIFYKKTLDDGLYLPRGHIWFVSLSHRDEDIARTLEISESALKYAKQKV